MYGWTFIDYARILLVGIVLSFGFYHIFLRRKSKIVQGEARVKNYIVRCHHEELNPSHNIVKRLLAAQQGTHLIDSRLVTCDPTFSPDTLRMRFVFQQKDKRSKERKLVEVLDISIDQNQGDKWKAWCQRNCNKNPFDLKSPAPYQLDWTQQKYLEREDKDRIPEGWNIGSSMTPYASALISGQ